ncbi:MAG: lysophospholipid acyltransferase family protein [Planctomycetes bacterium]|nr:lysophospholipid acyltransferase family protein [Planctomycetota bacterium]
MSVASEKTAFNPWTSLQRYRRYGSRAPGDFSFAEKLKFGVASGTARLVIRSIFSTCRWQVEGDDAFRDDLLQRRRSFIFLLWHNRMPAFFAYATSLVVRNPAFSMESIISASRDGELLARPIRELSGGEIRGSSSKDAAKALRTAVALAKAGSNIASVGDGPRGPRYRLKPGLILLARESGLPIIPVTWAGSGVLQMHRAWDQLMIPLPGSRIRLRFDAPVSVAPDADARQIARTRRNLEQRMKALTDWADTETRIRIQFPKPKPGEVLKRRPRIELEGKHFDD